MTSILGNLPTDNLYKFMAILGIVLIIVGAYFPSAYMSRLTLDEIALQGKLSVEVKLLDFAIEEQENRTLKLNYIDDLIDEWHEGDSDLELYEYLGMTFEEYKKLIEGK